MSAGYAMRGSARRQDPQAQALAGVEVDAARRLLRVRFAHGIPIGAGYAHDPRAYVLTGGDRIFPRIVGARQAGADSVTLQLDRIGDFSTYTLCVDSPAIDPFAACAPVRFRLDCEEPFDPLAGPAALASAPPVPVVVDYLAKDYAGFRQALLDFAAARYPEWTERSEADFTTVVVELFAWAADMLSYLQDRVGTEAFLDTARRRESVAAHLALIGYAIDQGASAETALAFSVRDEVAIVAGEPLRVSNVPVTPTDAVVVFETSGDATLLHEHNRIGLYDWGDRRWVVPRDAHEAALAGRYPRLHAGALLAFRDVSSGAADVVRLVAEPLVAGDHTLVTWDASTPLRAPYAAAHTELCANVVAATHGETQRNVTLRQLDAGARARLERDRALRPPGFPAPRLRVALPLGPLTFLAQPPASPAAEHAAPVTARVARSVPAITVRVGDDPSVWRPVVSLLDHGPRERVFAVDVDDAGDAAIVFGDDRHGLRPPDDATIHATFRIGGGVLGNVAAQTLTVLRPPSPSAIVAVTNPVAATGGRAGEPRDAARRFASAAFETPLALIGPEDYADAARSLRTANGAPLVDAARAELAWNGSWSTARVAVLPRVRGPLPASVASEVCRALEPRRLAGVDVDVVGVQRFPIALAVAVRPARGADPTRLREGVERALTGEAGLFRPGAFGFGEAVYVGRVTAATLAVPGVAAMRIDTLAPLHSANPARATRDAIRSGVLAVPADRVVQLDADRNAPERGTLLVTVTAR